MNYDEWGKKFAETCEKYQRAIDEGSDSELRLWYELQGLIENPPKMRLRDYWKRFWWPWY